MVGVGRGELTDKAWAQIQPLPPAGGRPGGRWSDHRMVINGILWSVEWVVSVDASVIRAHQHAAARRRPARAEPKGGPRTRRMRRWGTAGVD
jgi:transposase